MINYAKSGVFYSPNVGAHDRANLNRVLGGSNPLNTGRYLGLPSLIDQRKKEIFGYIRDRLWSKLQLWRGKNISKVGKAFLLKTAAQAIPAYCMSTFLLPSTLLYKIHRMMNSFWSGHGLDLKKGVKWVRGRNCVNTKTRVEWGFVTSTFQHRHVWQIGLAFTIKDI